MQFALISESSNYREVAKIYEEGLKMGMATFETTVPDWNKWDTNHLLFGRIAIKINTQILGWASLSPVSSRCVYGGVAEKIRGKKLLQELIKISEKQHIWTLHSGIMKASESSIQMHVNCGFRVIGSREKIGKLLGIWLDNVILERRSKIIGT